MYVARRRALSVTLWLLRKLKIKAVLVLKKFQVILKGVVFLAFALGTINAS